MEQIVFELNIPHHLATVASGLLGWRLLRGLLTLYTIRYLKELAFFQGYTKKGRCPFGGILLDCFAGTAIVCVFRHEEAYIHVELMFSYSLVDGILIDVVPPVSGFTLIGVNDAVELRVRKFVQVLHSCWYLGVGLQILDWGKAPKL